MQLIRWLALLALALLLPGSAWAAYRLAPEPAWVVVDAVPEPNTSAPGTDGTRYLLVVDQIDLSGRRPVWHRRVSYTIEAERGLADGGRFSIAYQPDYQSVALHHVQVWRQGVASERRDAVQIQELRREDDLESGILDGEHTLDVTIPDLKVGDRVDFSYSIEGFNPVFGNAYYDGYAASYGDPIGLRRVRAIYRTDRPLHWRVTRPGYDIRSGALGDLRYVDISASRVPRVRAEGDSPAGYDDYGRIELSTADSWSDIVRWSMPLYPVGFTDRAVADGLVRELRLADSDKLAAMQRAIAFVQGQIRYTALDMGENSHAPNRPEVTLARRFGDCKDKALLLVGLLHEAGIGAEPVLVNTTTRQRIAERLPSGMAFDHVVVKASVDGRDYWIDATRDREVGALAERPPLPFKLGLPVCAGCTKLVAIPDPMPAKPQVQVAERIALGQDGEGYTADFTVTSDYRGGRAHDMRDSFADDGEAEFGRRYLRYMRNYYDGITSPVDPSTEEREAGTVFRTIERYRLAWKADEGSAFGIVLFQLLDYAPQFEERKRKSPIAIGGPRLAVQTARVTYAKGWAIDSETEKVANDYFSFRRTVKRESGELVVSAEWRRLAEEVPAADVAKVGKDLRKVRDLLVFTVDLDGSQMPALLDPRAWAWPMLALALGAGILVLAWRQRGRSRLAGMLYQPLATMAQVFDGPPRPGRVWLLIVLMGLIEALFTKVPEYLDKGGSIAVLVALGAGLGLVLRTLLYTVVFGWALQAVRVRAGFDRLLASSAWGAAPAMVLFLGLALVAIGGDLTLLKDGASAPEHAVGLVMAALLAATGSLWALVSMVGAHAVAAATTRRRVLAAWGVLILALGLLVGGIVLLARL